MATDADLQGKEDGTKGGGSPHAIAFPADPYVWAEARKLLGDGKIRVEDLATVCLQDPVLSIELLRTANAMFFAGDRAAIGSVKTCIVRLGSDVVLKTFDALKDRPLFEDAGCTKWFEVHRARCRRTAIIARVLSEAVAKTLSDDCQAAALLLNVGDLLAVAHFKNYYVGLAEAESPSSVKFKLIQQKKFDTEKMGLTYLKRNGIPESLLVAIDVDGVSRASDRAILKPLVHASGEIVDAFDNGRWDKLAPGRTLPPKSPLRMLQIGEPQYVRIYERCSEFLFSSKIAEEKKRARPKMTIAQIEAQAVEPASTPSGGGLDLEGEIQSLIRASGEFATPTTSTDTSGGPSTKGAPATLISPSGKAAALESFGIAPPKPTDAPKIARTQPPEPGKAPVATPSLHTEKATAIVSKVSSLFDSSKTAEELLSKLMDMLLENGLFEKSAIVVVSNDRKKAMVVAARGPGIQNRQKLELTDPLSPLAQCFSKVRSFSTREQSPSPWGSTSYAVAPIDADHTTPVALYADCGKTGAVSFEARRIFRTVVELLNKKLPTIPGGIPVELLD